MGRILLTSILTVFSLLSTACSSLLYYPTQEHQYLRPSQFGLQEQDVWLEVPNKNPNKKSEQKIHGWWFPAQVNKKDIPAKGVILFFHGNAENLTSHFASLSWLPKNGYSYFIFDYPGYGLSPGKPTPEGNLEAGKTALDWIHQKNLNIPIFVYGQSLGGNVAMRTVLDKKSEISLKGVIIDSSFLSYQKIGRHKLSEHWFSWPFQLLPYLVLSDKYAPKDIGELAPTPLLVIHGQKDPIVEPRWGDEIFEQAKEPKEMIRIPDGWHGSSFWAHNLMYRDIVLTWLNQKK